MDDFYVNNEAASMHAKGICPYCGSNAFRNSWGNGNACCVVCEQEFIVRREGPCVVGEALSPTLGTEER